MVLKNNFKRENNEIIIIIRDNLKRVRISDDKTLENMKKYYNIDDHTDLLKIYQVKWHNKS